LSFTRDRAWSEVYFIPKNDYIFWCDLNEI
jgi:hypothetical protein